MACAQFRAEADWHQQAYAEVNHRMHQLEEQLWGILSTLENPQSLAPKEENILTLTRQWPSSHQNPSLWRRIHDLFGKSAPRPLEARSRVMPITLKIEAKTPEVPMLMIHCLGSFRVLYGGEAITVWGGHKGLALLKYLVTYRETPVAKDILMETFWPNCEPESTRNRLNVALHNLRQAFRSLTDMPIVLYKNGAYRLNPELKLWVDIDLFETHLQAGRTLEAENQLEAALEEYQKAIELYQGDYLADDPYEEWPLLLREKLRSSHLEALDRLSHIYFEQERYGEVVPLCQRILEHDACREDIHCRLMRCYSRQGQDHLALKQYQLCLEMLKNELDVEPATTTTQLYERIRQRESV